MCIHVLSNVSFSPLWISVGVKYLVLSILNSLYRSYYLPDYETNAGFMTIWVLLLIFCIVSIFVMMTFNVYFKSDLPPDIHAKTFTELIEYAETANEEILSERGLKLEVDTELKYLELQLNPNFPRRRDTNIHMDRLETGNEAVSSWNWGLALNICILNLPL